MHVCATVIFISGMCVQPEHLIPLWLAVVGAGMLPVEYYLKKSAFSVIRPRCIVNRDEGFEIGLKLR